jgi:hypothetical protein
MKTNKQHKWFLILSLAILLIAMLMFFFSQEKPITIVEQNMTINVSVKPEVVVSPELDFGGIPPGSIGTKKINITNTENYDITVRVYKSGAMASFIEVEPVVFVPSGQTIELTISAKVPTNIFRSKYTGKLRMETFRSK